MPALERLAVREISGRFLSQDERIELADLLHAGLSRRQIAARLGRAPSTISRELRRNAASAGSTVRSRPSTARPPAGPATTRGASRPALISAGGRRAAGPAVEPAADQPPAAPAVP